MSSVFSEKRLTMPGAVLAVGWAALLHPVGAFSSSVCSRAGATPRLGSALSTPSEEHFLPQRSCVLCPKLRRTRFETHLSSSSSFGDDHRLFGTGRSLGGDGSCPHSKSELSASTLTEIPYDFPLFDDSSAYQLDKARSGQHAVFDDAKNLLSAAFLITGNTVGASILCLPDYAAGPGMEITAALLLGIFGINLISGLLIAELAITQFESSRGDVPSSFKDFADATLQNPTAGNVVASISVFANWCVLSYSLMRAGSIASTSLPELGVDSIVAATGVAAALAGLVGSQTNTALSQFASVAVTVLFASFAGLLLPGLANVHDPIGTLFAPGTASTSIFDSAVTAVPIFLSSMVYQNIVPTITKLLNYDRSRSALAIFIGSLIPTLMYMSFSYAVLGGGLDSSIASGGPFLTAFSVASLTGSSIAGIMSIAEEFDSILTNFSPKSSSPSASSLKDRQQPTAQSFSILSVLLAVVPPLLAGVLFSEGENFSTALKYSGGYGVPALYGLLPVVMAMAQRKGDEDATDTADNGNIRQESLVPGGVASLSLLGITSAGFVGQEFITDMGTAIASAIGNS